MRKIYPAPPDEIRICEICEQPFTCGQREWKQNFRQRRTCGLPCGRQLAARNKTRLLPRACLYCQELFKPVTHTDKYCSMACSAADKRGKPATYSPPRIARVELICPQCQKVHLKRAKEIKNGRAFCSRRCYRLFHSKQGLGRRYPYVGSNDFYLSAAWSHLKRVIKKRDGSTCQGCHRTFRCNSPGMIVHHIRPRELFHTHGADLHAMADDPKNLVTLCRPCHQQTHAGHFPQWLDLGPLKVEQLKLFA